MVKNLIIFISSYCWFLFSCVIPQCCSIYRDREFSTHLLFLHDNLIISVQVKELPMIYYYSLIHPHFISVRNLIICICLGIGP